MEKSKEYLNTIFSVETIKEAVALFDILVKDKLVALRRQETRDAFKDLSDDDVFYQYCIFESMNITVSGETISYDSLDEFYSDYRKYDPYTLTNSFGYSRNYKWSNGISIRSYSGSCSTVSITVNGQDNNRSVIEKVFDVFETASSKAKLPYEELSKPKIYLGHGRSTLWRDLKDHLHDKHSYEVIAYEVGSRAGHVVRDILEGMLKNSSIAFLIMTAEDQTDTGQFRARQNVIHEIGLFQGKLGFNRAIVLLEQGTEEFTNIQGIDQIRFSKGNIKETYGDVLATIKREFH